MFSALAVAAGAAFVHDVLMSVLPSGTVTLLFSDIEGSTSLLSRLGDAYATALSAQREMLRAAWRAHGGTEMGTEGDSFFVVFETAQAALSAAVQGQQGLSAYLWPGGESVRVRMGVHTGSPMVHDGSYVGMDVHRAARIAGAAHGGQVVVSAATLELARTSLPDGVRVRDLGSHRLKDLPDPEHLFQLDVEGTDIDFPPLRSLGASTSLPEPLTPLVGRDGELAELSVLIRSSQVRLVTLTGPGGSGKTRLAISLARRTTESFPDGVYFVPLSMATTPRAMRRALADALNITAEAPMPAALLEHLEHRRALLVLDNLEQLADADAVVSELLASAPSMTVVSTSRRPLHLPGEHEHAVPPLELPDADDVDAVLLSGAAQLFAQRARRIRSDFAITNRNAADVANVCRRLDGLPLALELAASRIKLLSPRAILALFSTGLDLATTGEGAPERQKTLRNTIAWSHDLLTAEQQELFRRLGVFASGADIDAVTAVTSVEAADALDLVTGLLDASLLTVAESADGEPRIGMLQTIRAYSLGQLRVSGELDEVRTQQARHYLDLIDSTMPAPGDDPYQKIRRQFQAEHDNISEVLLWALNPSDSAAETIDGRFDLGLRLCAALHRPWAVSGRIREARGWLELGVERSRGPDRTVLAEFLGHAALFSTLTEDFDRAEEWATASIAMWRRLGVSHLPTIPLHTLAFVALERGQPDQARMYFEEAIAGQRPTGDRALLWHSLTELVSLEAAQRNFQKSLEFCEEALDLANELGGTQYVLNTRGLLANTLRQLGRTEEAAAEMQVLVPKLLKLDFQAVLPEFTEDYAAICAARGRHRLAVQLFGAAEAMRERIGSSREWAQRQQLAEPIAETRRALSDDDWNTAFQQGQALTIEKALTDALERS